MMGSPTSIRGECANGAEVIDEYWIETKGIKMINIAELGFFLALFGSWLLLMWRFWLFQEALFGKSTALKVKILSMFALKGVVAAIAIYIAANIGNIAIIFGK